MDKEKMSDARASAKPVDRERLKQFNDVLGRYHAGLAKTKSRIVSSESWWKLRNTSEERKTSGIGERGGFCSVSGWLHNVITSKHADAVEAYPEPVILPREADDCAEAEMLSSIIPCILEQNKFEKTYSDVAWQKLKTGTGCYKVIWDSSKLGGLGDISIEKVNVLNLFWEPGVCDIQDSKYVFHTELCDKEELLGLYPELEGKLYSGGFIGAKFLYDDTVDTSDKACVVEVYYKKLVNGAKTLQYAKYVGEELIYATENETESEDGGVPMALSGLYDHAKYPFVLDALFPIEGSPCGYGYVDLCRSPQTEIDLMKTAFLKNVVSGATPRYFSRLDGNVNIDEFLDVSNPIVSVAGGCDEASLRKIDAPSLDGVYVSFLDRTINELRETSGNTETSTGNVSSGVTAAAAIAALQEASSKGARDSTLSAYRSFALIVEMCIELIRQFYNMPRKFRIVGSEGAYRYVSYAGAGTKPQHLGGELGLDMGYRLPTFDVKVAAQKKSAYSRLGQNEMALQLFGLGFFRPDRAAEALACLDLLEFEGKERVKRRIGMGEILP